MTDRPSIAIIGSGNVGASLARRLASAGYELRFGVRPGKDIAGVLEQLRSGGATVSAASPQEAARGAAFVFLAIPAAAAVEAVGSLGELGSTIVVDCTNPLRWSGGPIWAPPAEGSVTQAIAAAATGARKP